MKSVFGKSIPSLPAAGNDGDHASARPTKPAWIPLHIAEHGEQMVVLFDGEMRLSQRLDGVLDKSVEWHDLFQLSHEWRQRYGLFQFRRQRSKGKQGTPRPPRARRRGPIGGLVPSFPVRSTLFLTGITMFRPV